MGTLTDRTSSDSEVLRSCRLQCKPCSLYAKFANWATEREKQLESEIKNACVLLNLNVTEYFARRDHFIDEI